MKKTIFKVVGTAALAVITNNAMALSVTPSSDASALANSLVGSGVSISGASLIGSEDQQGYFTDGIASGIGIDSGILLTSGAVSNAVGPNNLTNATAETGTGSNADLSALTGLSSFDQNVLTFDFMTTTGDLFFDYVFASEEYNEYVGSGVNDVFAFFVDGVNIALVPGTSTPVSVDTVNLSVNSALYNNNESGTYNTQYDGFTDVFTASILGLAEGSHTISLAISDSGDDILDSGVFIKAGSFVDVDPDVEPNGVPEASSIYLLAFGLLGLFGVARRKVRIS